MRPRWHQNAVIYQIDPALFFDANGDGWGDLAGVARRLTYVRELGADCIWLLPFYASPRRDGGYDVTDHLAVDPRLGDLTDFAGLIDLAEALGLRVLIDLVPQHTSIDHRWFTEARRDPESPFRDYYIWADEPYETDVEPVFPTQEESVWTWDEVAGQYYRHAFYSHEPDLELGNPRVRQEIFRIMSLWLRLGVSGFRIDAVPYMIERARAADDRQDGLWLLEDLRRHAASHNPDAVLLGEVDVAPEAYADYLQDSRLTMMLDFWKNNHLFLALARHDAEPLRRAIDRQPVPPEPGQYAAFLRNHDELDLEQLTQSEREEVAGVFAPEERMRAFGRGIRRRLAPMLGGDVRRIAMTYALLLGLPGPQVLLYGDEIGMGEDLDRPDRASVRTPMQWSDAPQAGFSRLPVDQLPVKPISDGPFNYRDVNCAAQLSHPDSLLRRVAEIIRMRHGALEIGTGHSRVLDVGNSAVLCLEHRWRERLLITAVNLAPEPADCRLPADAPTGLADVLADDSCPAPSGDPASFRLNGYGYRWLRRRDETC